MERFWLGAATTSYEEELEGGQVTKKTLAPVVAAAIVDDLDRPTQLLAAARAYPEELAGQYELPGGKVEPGESPQSALAREIREELGCNLALGPLVRHLPQSPRNPVTRQINTGDSTQVERATLLSSASAELGPTRADAWPLLNGRVMWVWLAEVAPDSPTPEAGDSHQHLRWVSLNDAAELDWLASNRDIVAAVTSLALRMRP